MTESEKRRQKLLETEQSRPSDYVSQYGDALGRIKQQQESRSFDWSPEDDRLYQQYADRYIREGKLAMKDTVGQSAALTGGYGNSYAHIVGQQAYDEYLGKLSGAALDIYSKAYEKYLGDGDDLQQQYENLTEAEKEDYRRWKNALDQWNREYERDADAADSADKTERQGKTDAYDALYKLIINSGYVPKDEELEASGMTREAAEALRQAYLANLAIKQSGGSGGSSGGRSGGSGNSSSDNAGSGSMYSAVNAECAALKTAGASSSVIASKINAAYSAGRITAAERQRLLQLYG